MMPHIQVPPISWTPRQEQILAVMEDLSNDPSIGLNEIDGEFFWRFCQRDTLVGAAGLARATRNSFMKLSDQEWLELQTRPDHSILGQFRDLDSTPKATEDFGENEDVGIMLMLADAIRARKRLPLYQTPFLLDSLNSGTQLRLRVFSQNFKGREIERYLEELPKGEVNPAPVDPDRCSIQVECSVGKLTSQMLSEAAPGGTLVIERPYVEMLITLPLPPQGTIAKLWDEWICRDRKWHAQLSGAAKRHTSMVAIRGWALALLLADPSGTQRFAKYNEELQERLRLGKWSRKRFLDVREEICDRVPRARPCFELHSPE